MDNTITLVGNLTADPDLAYTASGVARCNFSLAVNRRVQKNGNWESVASFFDVIAWRELGENLAQSCAKGDRVIVQGRLEQSRWQADDGSNRSRVQVVADSIGPDLRWATASVTRAERSNGGIGDDQADAY